MSKRTQMRSSEQIYEMLLPGLLLEGADVPFDFSKVKRAMGSIISRIDSEISGLEPGEAMLVVMMLACVSSKLMDPYDEYKGSMIYGETYALICELARRYVDAATSSTMEG